ncbi:MAG: peptide chain release factor N(5)-glutamine methyltransferase [Acidobacteriota bacterium]|nr:peptide chain release factor N(5)-glutamine methyltransferase [Acidobacteriota bacterium]
MTRLTEGGVPSPSLGAELLLMHALGISRGDLHAFPEREIPPETAQQYFELVSERLTGKPTQYITGHQEFWGLDFIATPDVLIPRPETEHVVEAVVEIARSHLPAARGRPCIADVGTGSGCIAVALGSELPEAEIHALDISPAALSVAALNVSRHGLSGRIRLIESDLLRGLLEEGRAGQFDLVSSNPPYVGLNDLEMVQREVKEFEPRIAWGGLDREDAIYRRLFPEALELLKPGGWLVVEIGYNMREQVTRLLQDGWFHVEVRPDLSGIPRVVTARRQ